MARKARPEEKPINSSSAEEDDGASSADGSGSESEGPAPLSTKKVVDSSSDDDEAGSETDSGSDSDSPPAMGVKPDPSIKPISSKPMDDAAPAKNPKSSGKAAVVPATPPPPAKPTAKRPAEEGEEKEGKKGKRSDGGGVGEDSKNKLFQRIWSEDDEIVILEGMIDYAEKKGADPFTDLNAFYNFIKKSLHVDVNKAQLSAKARRLKQKYENNLVREKQGKVRSFSNPHEKRAYELSKKVWASASDLGNGNGEGSSAGVKGKSKSTVKVNGTAKNVKGKASSKSLANGIDAHKEVSAVATEEKGEKSQSQPFHIGGVGVPFTEEAFMKNGWELIADSSKRAELAEQWKELRMQEMELYLKRVELIQTQTKLVLDEMKAANK